MRKLFWFRRAFSSACSDEQQPRRSSSLLLGFAFLLTGCFLATNSNFKTVLNPSRLAEAHRGNSRLYASNRCQGLQDFSVEGDFKELSCLIMHRRLLKAKHHPLDKVIFARFRALFRRLQTQPDDENGVGQWQMLYRLSTQMYPVRNRWAPELSIPLYVVNSHHMALPFWIKESLRRRVGPLLHFDTHSDMRPILEPQAVRSAVRNLRNRRQIKESWHTIAHSVGHCAMPVSGAILSQRYKDVVWGRPSWTSHPDFLRRKFFFGVFLNPAQPRKRFFTPAKRGKRAKPKPVRWPDVGTDIWEGLFRMYSLRKSPLDREFSPFALDWLWVPKSRRPIANYFRYITPFEWSVIHTDQPIQKNGTGPGSQSFQQLLKVIPRGPFTLDIDLDYFASVDADKLVRRKQSSKPPKNLYLLEKRRKVLVRRLRNFENLLFALRKQGRVPAVITIADSTSFAFALDAEAQGQSEYTPQEHAVFLHENVRRILVRLYGAQVWKTMQKRKRTQQKSR